MWLDDENESEEEEEVEKDTATAGPLLHRATQLTFVLESMCSSFLSLPRISGFICSWVMPRLCVVCFVFLFFLIVRVSYCFVHVHVHVHSRVSVCGYWRVHACVFMCCVCM